MSRDKKRHGILNGRIAYHVINSGWTGNLLAILNHTSDMKAQGFCRSAPRFFQSSTSRNAPRKIWEAHAKIRVTILVQICDVIHQSPQPNACFSMLLSVPIGISRTGCGTVTRPVFTGCLNCLWLPTCATSYQPSCFKRCMISRLDIIRYTLFTHLSSRGLLGLREHDGSLRRGREGNTGCKRSLLRLSLRA